MNIPFSFSIFNSAIVSALLLHFSKKILYAKKKRKQTLFWIRFRSSFYNEFDFFCHGPAFSYSNFHQILTPLSKNLKTLLEN